MLAFEVKRKQSPKEPPSLGKQKDTRKPVVEKLEQTILEQIKVVEEIQNPPHIETPHISEQEMAKEGEGSTRINITPEWRLEYERQQKEWQRQREEERRIEAERKAEEDKRA